MQDLQFYLERPNDVSDTLYIVDQCFHSKSVNNTTNDGIGHVIDEQKLIDHHRHHHHHINGYHSNGLL